MTTNTDVIEHSTVHADKVLEFVAKDNQSSWENRQYASAAACNYA